MALLLVYLAKMPFELIFAGILSDSIYYFGEGFWLQNRFAVLAFMVVILSLVLDSRIHWHKVI